MSKRVMLIQGNESELDFMPVKMRPLALESLAAHLDNHIVKIVDLRVDQQPLEVHLGEFLPDIVGITCTFTSSLRIAKNTIKIIREKSPQAIVVVGGVHASLMPDDFASPYAHYVVKGQGERTFAELVDNIDNNDDVAQVAGLYIVNESGLKYTGDRPKDYKWSEEYRFPARGLTAGYLKDYTLAPTGEPLVFMVSSRGCPYRCNFCAAWKLQGGKYDTRTAKSIFDEIVAVEENFVYFFDDNSFANRKVMKELAQMLRVEGVKKTYQVWTSTDVIRRDADLVAQWRDIGLFRIFTGLEGIRDEQLLALDKRSRMTDNEEAIRICRDLGILLTPTFIVDMTYGADDFRELGQYADDRALFLPYFTILTPLPGTDLFRQLAPSIIEGDPSRFDLLHLTCKPEKLSPKDFMNLFVDLYQGSKSWKEVSDTIPVFGQFLDALGSLREQYTSLIPVAGLDPDEKAFTHL